MLEVKDLCVRYGDAEVLHNLRFTVQSGEWLMVSGPNGAGKSTLLEAISQGVAYTGEVLLDGTDIRRLKPRRRAQRMGLLHQRYAAGYAFTAEEIVRLGRYAHHDALGGLTQADEAAVRSALELTGTWELRRHAISRISGGELQRVFLAQLFAQNPSLLLLDEPSNHLDLKYQKQILELVQTWLQTESRAVISVVHDLSVARRFGTRVLLLDQGHIAADAAPETALDEALLRRVYGMDVAAWMRGIHGVWTG